MKAGVASFYWSHLSTARCVLDLGCGFGDLGLYKPEAVKLLGLDINPNAAKQATGPPGARCQAGGTQQARFAIDPAR